MPKADGDLTLRFLLAALGDGREVERRRKPAAIGPRLTMDEQGFLGGGRRRRISSATRGIEIAVELIRLRRDYPFGE